MDILYILIPLSLLQVAIAVALYLWAVKRDQFEDYDGPAEQILMDLDLDSALNLSKNPDPTQNRDLQEKTE